MILFEDELADNGISIFNVKIRVMNERLLLLSRDQRIQEFEGKYQMYLLSTGYPNLTTQKAALRDSNWVAQNTPMIKRQCEIIQF
ncbi:BEM_collapsed_G0058280.mRNA.1.CDS.1 [Saccharomyces cerevisiae]|nr:BEM_collapsed_G0058280.mRNA.1.CDS.1 [Saccharomyces cerevisiae]